MDNSSLAGELSRRRRRGERSHEARASLVSSVSAGPAGAALVHAVIIDEGQPSETVGRAGLVCCFLGLDVALAALTFCGAGADPGGAARLDRIFFDDDRSWVARWLAGLTLHGAGPARGRLPGFGLVAFRANVGGPADDVGCARVAAAARGRGDGG